ncbi:hypothetical protein M422DRAFT_62129 [Sphaerobolus stellatus SS14]|uniref:Nucleolar protein 12 n=1 Tax=Sphaerobolus stellatus (strain SS14) TaxID=990650 RepID=A0A0C9UBR5_SPHS4|nr:hypothetical protein M422DRAFT_62129 [Sphaerobolus stellatus SS14]
MSTRNTTIFSQAHAIYTAKKKAKKEQIQEVVFDEEARREYLTGFRKRNIRKKEDKRNKAIERERLERLEMRKQHRHELAERAAQNAKEVESALGMFPADDADSGSVAESVEAQEEEMEFEDEEQLAVVTVVEDFNPESVVHPAPRPSMDKSGSDLQPTTVPQSRESVLQEKKKPLKARKPKSKPKKIHYETQAARKAERTKQRSRRAEKAERAGGKTLRRSKR